MFKLKIPKKTNYKNFFEKEGLGWIVEASNKKINLKDSRINE